MRINYAHLELGKKKDNKVQNIKEKNVNLLSNHNC